MMKPAPPTSYRPAIEYTRCPDASSGFLPTDHVDPDSVYCTTLNVARLLVSDVHIEFAFSKIMFHGAYPDGVEMDVTDFCAVGSPVPKDSTPCSPESSDESVAYSVVPKMARQRASLSPTLPGVTSGEIASTSDVPPSVIVTTPPPVKLLCAS